MSSEYRNGNIYRIYLKDFLTYDEISVYPKPYLNVVIGPNGTGKSSILCAICLGLGGNPEVTGRGKQVLEYIKHGKEQATIELELYHENGNIIIKRCFKRNISKNNADNKWYLQGNPVTSQKVKDIAGALGIQVNNLCQFLPQDRVTEFAKLDKIQLLQSTERAIGEKELANQHEILCQNGKNILEKEVKLKEVQKQLDVEILKNDKVKDQVNNIKNKETLDSSIKDLKEVIVLRKYNSAHAKFKEDKENLDFAKREYKENERLIEPKRKQIEKIRINIENLDSFLKKQTEVVKKHEKEIYQLTSKFVSGEDMMLNTQEEFKIVVGQNESIKKQIHDQKRQLEVLKGQVEGLNNVNEEALLKEIKDLTAQIHSKSLEYTDLQNSTGGLENNYRLINEERKKILMEMKNILDIKRQRVGLLNRPGQGKLTNQYKQIYMATTEFLNKHAHLFKGKVYDPLFTNIDLDDQRYAIYLENTISNRDMIAFVFEEKDDIEVFKEACDRNGWSVNLLHSQPCHPDIYKPRIPIENIRQFGFQCYLKDVIKAPHAIISYLCRNFNIHNIPVSLLEKLHVEFDNLPDEISLFFYGGSRVSKKRSTYDNNLTTSVSGLQIPKFLTISSNAAKINFLEDRIKDLTNREALLRETLEKQRMQLQQTNTVLEKLRTLKSNALVKKNERQQLENRCREKEAVIVRREASIPDLLIAEQKMNETVTIAITILISTAEKVAFVEHQIADICQKCIETSIDLNQEQKSIVDRKNEIKESSEHCENMKKRVVEMERAYKASQENAKIFLTELYNLLGLQQKDVIPNEVKQQLRSYSGDSMDVLEKKLAEKEVSRDCLVSADEKVVNEFKRREVLIDKLRKDVHATNKNIENERQLIDECRREWLPRVTDLISKINQHFSEFMSRLHCAGEVHLEKGQNEDDFSKYGLAIQVKFRDSEKLKDLTAHQQSGGERSVSTALYLLALQTLTAVPFRCVDEINQGMDPTNEMNMFTMLVETTTTETASQYFLVTPKLLPDLPHNSRVNFLIVHNGPNLEHPRYFSMTKTLSYLKKKKKIRGHRFACM